MTLIELAQEVLTPIDAPAGFVCSQLVGPDVDGGDGDGEIDEWVALDAAVARRIAAGGGAVVSRGGAVVLRVGPGLRELLEAPREGRIALEAVVSGDGVQACTEAAEAVERALGAGVRVRAVLATGATGIDAYRAAACARRVLGTRVPIRVRWDDVLDVKGAALALTFGADELAGPLAPPQARFKLAQVGGPAEDVTRPSPSYVESLIRAAGRLPARAGARR